MVIGTNLFICESWGKLIALIETCPAGTGTKASSPRQGLSQPRLAVVNLRLDGRQHGHCSQALKSARTGEEIGEKTAKKAGGIAERWLSFADK